MISDFFDSIIQLLFLSPAVSAFNVLKQVEGEDEGYHRIKCTLANKDILEFAEYVRIVKKRIHIVTYSFHWQNRRGKLIKRWDNVRHHPEIETFPYHVHLTDGSVSGSVPVIFDNVLKEIESVVLSQRAK